MPFLNTTPSIIVYFGLKGQQTDVLRIGVMSLGNFITSRFRNFITQKSRHKYTNNCHIQLAKLLESVDVPRVLYAIIRATHRLSFRTRACC